MSFRIQLALVLPLVLGACGSRQDVGSTGATYSTSEPEEQPASEAAVPAAPRAPITMLALGHEHTCALTEDGAVHCWGGNGHDQLGDSEVRESAVPMVVGGLPPMAAIWSGYDSTCARARDDSGVYCWGDTGLEQERQGFAQVLPLTEVHYVALGYQKGCVLRGSGELHCWGDYGRPHGPVWSGIESVDVRAPAAVSLGWVRGCSTTGRGRLQCWGQHPVYIDIERIRGGNYWTYQELADVSAVAFTEGIQALPLVLSRQGTVYQLELGQGHGHSAAHHLGRRTYELSGVVQIVAGGTHQCARSSDGSAACWGGNQRGQVGSGAEGDRVEEPVHLSLSGVEEIAVGSQHTCARTASELHCWGDNSRGQLGIEGERRIAAPTVVPW